MADPAGTAARPVQTAADAGRSGAPGPAPILVCAALPYECAALVGLLATPRHECDDAGRNRWSGLVGGTHVVLQETGIGLDAAHRAARRAIDALRPRCLIATGLAGGLSPAVAVGDAIVPDRVGRVGQTPIEVDRHLRARTAPELPEGRSRRGLLVSTEHVVRTPGEKRALAERTRADAVDMESAALLEQAVAAAVPALVIRAASDAAHDELPDLGGLDLSRRADQLRLLGRTLLSPARLGPLMRLARGGREANKTLVSVLARVLPRLH